ncbi:MAG: hydroxyisourate hydrolase [Actinomycetota bacterium]|nr:hydroxyisourate hydrolase [Actinomycetota bacterium]
MTKVTTHVLDTAAGRPAARVPVSLHERGPEGSWRQVGDDAVTNTDGRIEALPGVGPGVYRLVFDTATPFFDEVVVTFRVAADDTRLHIPLLLSPFGYSVYRGS